MLPVSEPWWKPYIGSPVVWLHLTLVTLKGEWQGHSDLSLLVDFPVLLPGWPCPISCYINSGGGGGGGASRSLNPLVSYLETVMETPASRRSASVLIRHTTACLRSVSRQVVMFFVLVSWTTARSHQTLQQVVDYLEHLAAVPLGHNTIIMHISALSSCTYECEGVSVSISLLVSAFVIGHKAWCPKKLRIPPCDLSAVLVALTEDWYKPLSTWNSWHLRFSSW